MRQLFISIHALREEGDPAAGLAGTGLRGISIHALREEGDDLIQLVTSPGHISIHALREEGDKVQL